ncbi:MAG: hypothetical protein MRERC_1c006 [Mycoplasmataceae bacterium RC_NB112A]|nr:MAG: hypothetical protein MRERC_9c066 [Mycoplasmataceae bacterium RC_NB112A]KLL02432.1 MAG: hypothetical protein MRERC_1c006 [Mycoplasmataceae bacterium RC_NB112A]
MIIIQIHPQDLSSQQLEQEKMSLTKYFQNLVKKENFALVSLLFQNHAGVSDGISNDPLDCKLSSPFIHEEVLNCRFRLSPRAFFQTNTAAAELLYQKCILFLQEIQKKIALNH